MWQWSHSSILPLSAIVRSVEMRAAVEQTVQIDTGQVVIEGMLEIPENAPGVVIFAHGSGSGRFSPRNQFVAEVLRERGIGTLLIDLLDMREANDREKVFDINLLTQRVINATDWIESNEDTEEMSIGYFGASTGAAAALQAAANRPEVKAVVSRGGRPDLAMDYLNNVTAPTLLIVGGNDVPVIALNKQAYNALSSTKEMIIVPRATHLFEEAGTLEEVARLAADWFKKYL